LYAQALKAKGRTGDQMKQLLEMRLDNFIYRAGFAMTRMQSRQFAAHGLFMVDGHRVTTPSYRIRPGQVITIRKQAKDSPVFSGIRDSHEKYTAPKWIKADPATLSAESIALPEAADAEHGVDMDLVIGYYSRK
jgi:small subunit ribosomal protein S4